MQVSQRGIDLIKQAEGVRLTAYPDPGTGGVPWTIGYGTTKGVTRGMTITQARAEQLLREDLQRFGDEVSRLVKVRLCQHQFDALVSLAYNIGATAFEESTLLRKLNDGEYDGAAGQFGRWVYGGGKILSGLVKRRAAEKALFEDAA